jgi:protein-disulfide isomerase
MKANVKKTKQSPKKENVKLIMIGILVVVVIQLIITISLILPKESISFDERVENIESKVNAIDNFFRSNVDGYDSQGSSVPSPGTSTPPSQKVEVSDDDDPWLGNEDAKVTVIEFSDYQCPFCRKYWTESYPQLKEEYIDTGKIKYVFRDFPLNFHPGAPLAAVAGNCVREQLGNEAYFKYHDIVFSEQNKQGQGTVQFGEDEIMSWVDQIEGIDKSKFNTCYSDPSQKAEVDADFAAGAAAGVSGTPSFFINGETLVGAQPYSVIKATIERALAE